MNVEILMATINQQDFSLLDKINLQTDIIVCNQNANSFSFLEFKKNGYNVRWYNFKEKGVGLNRNNALMRAKGDICLIADDDVYYDDDAMEKVLNAFIENPKADVILFNVHENNSYHPYIERKKRKVHRLNCGKYGGVRIAFRKNKVLKKAISFNLLFGGGAKYSAGEDNMFIRDCIRKGLNVYSVPVYILSLNNDRESTWFSGFNQKFFKDLGASYVVHFGCMAYFFAKIQLIRHKKIWLKNYSYIDAKNMVKKGIKEFKCY